MLLHLFTDWILPSEGGGWHFFPSYLRSLWYNRFRNSVSISSKSWPKEVLCMKNNTFAHRHVLQRFPANREGLGEAINLIKSFLEPKGLRPQEKSRIILAAEESIASLISHAAEGSCLRVSLRSGFGSVTVDLSMQGNNYNFWEMLSPDFSNIWVMPESQLEDTLRQILLLHYQDILKFTHKKNANHVRISVTSSSRSLYLTCGALLAAIVMGSLLSLLGPMGWINTLNTYALIPVKTMYMNALKMIAAPIVFFSIVGCFSRQGNPSELGRIGGKILGLYLLTTIIAVSVGIGIFKVFTPGNPSIAAGLTADVSSLTNQAVHVSIKDILVGIVPSNILAPFLESNMLQLIFLAILSGVVLGQMGRPVEPFEIISEFFMKLAMLIMRTTPIAVFCAILSMILGAGLSSLLSVLGLFFTFLVGLLCMIIIYCLILLISGLSPLHFLRKYGGTMLQVFSIASSNASITVNVEACQKKLGISPRIYSLSIPLGATINMDGTSILLAVQALTLAKIYGINVSGNMLFSLALSIIVMSIGAPGVPGSGLIILSMLLTQLGVPVEGVALVMGIGPLVGMFISMCNCLGDVVITTAVAKSEKQIDMEVYRKET